MRAGNRTTIEISIVQRDALIAMRDALAAERGRPASIKDVIDMLVENWEDLQKRLEQIRQAADEQG